MTRAHKVAAGLLGALTLAIAGAGIGIAQTSEGEVRTQTFTHEDVVTYTVPTPVTVTQPPITTTVTVTTTPAPEPSHIYWGARITAGFYATNYNGAGSDAPLTGSTDARGAWTLFEQHAGKEVSFVHWGGAGSAWPPSDFNATAAQRAWDNGAFSMYGLSLPKSGLDALLANNATAQTNLGKLAQQMAAWGKPILFRPLWEMNGSWFAWGRQNYTPQQYVTMWRNLWAIFQNAGATNVSFAWVPNSCSSTTVCSASDNVPDPSPWYPGDAYVDWTGFERYVKSGYMSPSEWGDPIYNTLATLAPSKPMVIGEMGVVAEATAPGKHQFYADFLATWLPNHPKIEAVNFFNDDGDTPNVQIEEGDGAGVLNGNALDSFRAGIASDYYLENAAASFPESGKIPVP